MNFSAANKKYPIMCSFLITCSRGYSYLSYYYYYHHHLLLLPPLLQPRIHHHHYYFCQKKNTSTTHICGQEPRSRVASVPESSPWPFQRPLLSPLQRPPLWPCADPPFGAPSQVYVTIERVQTRTGRHTLSRMMERSTLVTESNQPSYTEPVML
jgi:hypothetical protein